MQLPPAQEVLASLMSLASVQSPALTPTTDVVSKRPPLSTEEGQKLATKALQSRVWSQAQAQPSTGDNTGQCVACLVTQRDQMS